MFEDNYDHHHHHHPIFLNIAMETIQNFLFGRKLNTWNEPASLKCKFYFFLLFQHPSLLKYFLSFKIHITKEDFLTNII